MKKIRILSILVLLLAINLSFAQQKVWPIEKAKAWYESQPWLIGANYAPYNAINQLEMWQAESFDIKTIDKELSWAEQLGFNTLRVFLHDLMWYNDKEGFKSRLNDFLKICDKHHLRPMLVIFDSVWDPYPRAGKQKDPVQGLHNSAWVQSPGAEILTDTTQYDKLEDYVKGLITHFKDDKRILAWDIWNEPDNTNDASYKSKEPLNKIQLVEKLLPKVFKWAREANPSQPITSAIWLGNWSDTSQLKIIEKIQLNNSDIISFHNYSTPEDFENRIKWLSVYGRPLVCTEYMARPVQSTFQNILPVAKKYKVGMYNWGFVAGKSNTIYPWDSWQKAYVSEPPLWFHDIFRPDGQPYIKEEVEFIKSMTKTKKKKEAILEAAE